MPHDRRQFLRATTVVAATPLLSLAQEHALDDAWSQLHSQEPEAKQGLSTHAPMVAEALTALGHGDRAVAWIDNYRAPLLRLPPPIRPIDAKNWRAELGPNPGAPNWEAENPRWADWKAFFIAELDARPWRDVLDEWALRLAPGMSGAATHGVIRAGHAVRAIGRQNTVVRRAELARSLAYWASSYEELPQIANPKRMANFTDALAEVPLYTTAFGKSPEGRNIVEQLRHVKELEQFAPVKAWFPEPKNVDTALSALSATFTRVFLRHGTRHHLIAFLHAVTGPASLRRMAPYLKPETSRVAFGYAWQTAAAVYAAYARKSDDPRMPESTKLDAGHLKEAALKSSDEHAIKFTEVMLGEYALSPDPVYLAAAAYVCETLRRPA